MTEESVPDPDLLRLVQLSRESIRDMAVVHAAAFPNAMLSLLGSEIIGRYYLWQFDGPHDAVVLGSHIGGRLTGFCVAGVFRGALSGFVRANLPRIAVALLARPQLLMRPRVREKIGAGFKALWNSRRGRRRPTPRLRGSEEVVDGKGKSPASFGILALAVLPERRGLGDAQALMQEVELCARSRGFRTMNLTVAPDNERAVRFYRRNGWQDLVLKGRAGWTGAMVKSVQLLEDDGSIVDPRG